MIMNENNNLSRIALRRRERKDNLNRRMKLFLNSFKQAERKKILENLKTQNFF